MSASHASLPAWSWIAPIPAVALLIAGQGGHAYAGSGGFLAVAALFLGLSIFASVHHAEILALRLGEPFGSILLAVAVTVIEVALIVSIMLSDPGDGPAVARDTVFSAVMIVLNGVVGLCLVAGSRRHFEQSFTLQGSVSALAVLGTLAVMTLILPNHTTSASGPAYSSAQLAVVGLVSLVLYGVFVFVQTIRHRDYFLDAAETEDGDRERPGKSVAWLSLLLLVVCLTVVILLAKTLSKPLSEAVDAMGLPQALVGVVIAAVVLAPEGLAAVHSAVRNRLQNSLNLALGSAIASIGLTIPAVAVVSMITGTPLVLGITPANTALLSLTLFVSALTLGTGRTTVLQGAIHLAIFAVFLLVSAVP
jgi:Ca2+:H+ antiporter